MSWFAQIVTDEPTEVWDFKKLSVILDEYIEYTFAINNEKPKDHNILPIWTWQH